MQSTDAPTAQGRATATSKRASSHNGQESPPSSVSFCSVDGCGAGGRRIRGYCRAHYNRWLVNGSPTPFEPVEPMAGEEWRPVAGYDGLYSVSNLGRIRRERPAPARLLTPRWNSRRRYAALHLPGGDRYLHVLVAEAFLGPCPKGKEANHRDGDRKNNAASNLEFVTHSQNVRHALRLGLRRRKYGQQHLALAVEVGA